MKKNKIDCLLGDAADMLINIDDYSSGVREAMSKSLCIVYDRLEEADCLDLVKKHITKEEYEKYFEDFLAQNNYTTISDTIKKDYIKIQGEKKDDN